MFDSIKKDVSSLILKCMSCCNRIQAKKPGLKADLVQGQRDVEIAMLNGDYELAKSRIDSIIVLTDRLRAFDLLHAHLASVSEQCRGATKRKDVSVGVYATVCTVLYAVPLVSNDLVEMKDIGSLLRDICGKEIDQHVQEKRYTKRLVKGNYGALHLVDRGMVHVLNHRVIQAQERYQAISNICASRDVLFDEQTLQKHVGVFLESNTPAERYNEAVGHATTPSRSTGEFSYEKNRPSTSSSKKKKNKKSLGEEDELWETVFDRRASPSGGEEITPVTSRRGGWEVIDGAPSSDGSSRGSGLPPPMSAPGWDAPSPQVDGQMSFGRRFDNALEFHRRTSTVSTSTSGQLDHDEKPSMNPLETACIPDKIDIALKNLRDI